MRNIVVIRGHRVLLDSELASLYQVETKALTRAVRRNVDRFPADFMYQLTAEEVSSLRSQTGTFKTGRGQHRKYAPYVFTEQGVAMLSSVLKRIKIWRENCGHWRKNMTISSRLCLTQYVG